MSRKHLRLEIWLAALIGLAVLPGLTACSRSSEATVAPGFELTNQFGQATRLSQQQGKVVILTFLYTHCPDTCPVYLSLIQQAIAGLPNPEKVRVVVVTVDPQRDTVERLRGFASPFPPHWLFLTGTAGQLKVVWDNYRVYAERQGEGQAGHPGHQGYQIVHTAKVVLIDQNGNIAAELGGEWTAAELSDKISSLMAGEKVSSSFSPLRPFVAFLYRCGPVAFSTLGGALAHFAFMLTIPATLLVLYRWLSG